MLAINIPEYTSPANYQLSELPKPVVEDPKDVLIKVHAASVNPVDVKKAGGALKSVMKESFPYKIGYDCAGVVVEIGSEVTRFKVGDEVFVRLPEFSRGAWSEFAKTNEEFIALKPVGLSMGDAASVPLTAMTALQSLRRYQGDLAGKTVLVPAGLSGTGLFACQLAKNIFKASKVITIVSTSKVSKINELLKDGVVDEIIDYNKSDPMSVIPPRSVDFLFDTVGVSMAYLSLMRAKTGTIISISTTPSGDLLQNSSVTKRPPDGRETAIVPTHIRWVLNMIYRIRKARAWYWSVNYSYLFLHPNGEDLDSIRQLIEEGKLRTVVGTTAHFKDLKAVRDTCQVVYDGKGGVGKSVILFE